MATRETTRLCTWITQSNFGNITAVSLPGLSKPLDRSDSDPSRQNVGSGRHARNQRQIVFQRSCILHQTKPANHSWGNSCFGPTQFTLAFDLRRRRNIRVDSRGLLHAPSIWKVYPDSPGPVRRRSGCLVSDPRCAIGITKSDALE